MNQEHVSTNIGNPTNAINHDFLSLKEKLAACKSAVFQFLFAVLVIYLVSYLVIDLAVRNHELENEIIVLKAKNSALEREFALCKENEKYCATKLVRQIKWRNMTN